jgi:hypothetical protein
MNGDCYFSAEYGGETYVSNDFKISKSLDILLDIGQLTVKPGEEIVVSGTASRKNGVGINGDVEINIPLLSLVIGEVSDDSLDEVVEEESEEEVEDEEIDEDEEEEVEEDDEDVEEVEATQVNTGVFYGSVVDGAFSVSFTLAEDTPAGNYRIDVHAYEKTDEVITSEAVEMANLQILQVLHEVDIAISTQNIDPGQVFEFKPLLIDQAGLAIYDDVSVIITNEGDERIFEKILESEETSGYDVPTDLGSEYYNIEASIGELSSMKKFYVNEKAIVSFDIVNETLVVTNIGNILYDKDFEIELNGKPFVRSLKLDLDESKSFKLTGPAGSYNVKVSDGNTEIIRGGVALTGNVIGVKAINSGWVILKTPITWIFLIIFLGAGILFLFRNILKKKSIAYPFKGGLKKGLSKLHFGKKKVVDLKDNVDKSSASEENSPQSLIAPRQAEQVLVLSGQKNKVSVVALKVKNKLNKVAKKNLEGIVYPVFEKKGVVCEKGDYLLVIFSPLMTRTFKNELLAAKVAEQIQNAIKTYNRKFKEKIEIGIGVGSGEIINKIEMKKFRFTPLGNFISFVKKLASSSDGKILVSKETYDKGTGIKAEKKSINNSDVYELKRIVDSDENKKFIDSFLKRVGEMK